MGDKQSLMNLVRRRDDDDDAAAAAAKRAHTYADSMAAAPSDSIAPRIDRPSELMRKFSKFIVMRQITNPTLSLSVLGGELERTALLAREAYSTTNGFVIGEVGVTGIMFNVLVKTKQYDALVLERGRALIENNLRYTVPWTVLISALSALAGTRMINQTTPFSLAGSGASDDAVPMPLGADTPFPPRRPDAGDATMYGGALLGLRNSGIVDALVVTNTSPEMLRMLERQFGRPDTSNVTPVNQENQRNMYVFYDKNTRNEAPAAIAVPAMGDLTATVHDLLVCARVGLGPEDVRIVMPSAAGTAATTYTPRNVSFSTMELVENMAQTIHRIVAPLQDFTVWRNTVTAANLGFTTQEMLGARTAASGALDAFANAAVQELTNWIPGANTTVADSIRAAVAPYGLAADVIDRIAAAANADIAQAAAIAAVSANILQHKTIYASGAGTPFSTGAMEIVRAAGVHPVMEVVVGGYAELVTRPMTIVNAGGIVIVHTPSALQMRQAPGDDGYLLQPIATTRVGIALTSNVETFPHGSLDSLRSMVVAGTDAFVLPRRWLRSSPEVGATLRQTLALPAGVNAAAAAAPILDRLIVGTPTPQAYGVPLRIMSSMDAEVVSEALRRMAAA